MAKNSKQICQVDLNNKSKCCTNNEIKNDDEINSNRDSIDVHEFDKNHSTNSTKDNLHDSNAKKTFDNGFQQDINSEKLRELNTYCKDLGLCLRCQLRYLGELYSSAAFIGAQNELKNKINEILNENNQIISTVKKLKTDTFCHCCIGLLENGCEENNLSQILDKVNNFEYKFKDFQVNLFLPVAIVIREKIIHAKLLNKFRNLEIFLNECYSIKDVYKFIIIRKVSKLTGAKFNISSKTEITIETKYGNLQVDCLQLYSKCKNMFNLKLNQKFEVIFSQQAVIKALQKLTIKDLINLKLDRPDRCINIEKVSVTNHSLFIVGRYNKYSRELSQTPWFMNGVQKRESVEQIIVKAIKANIFCEKTKFSASGREDVDVQMLGRGRPFVIELFNPSTFDIDKNVFIAIRNDVKKFSNNLIDLKDLQYGDKDNIAKNLKTGEIEKKKSYRALCVSTRQIKQSDIDKLNSIHNLTIQQRTPLRVLHRRTLALRPKIIYDLEIKPIENESHKFYLNITTEAGTYVKEFVNSDFGRTYPSLETILTNCETDILELDVLEIHYDWPPFIEGQN